MQRDAAALPRWYRTFFDAAPDSAGLTVRDGWALGVALVAALVPAAVSVRTMFSAEFVVPTDARTHVFWAARYGDPSLFAGDFLADYFQSVAPFGHRLVLALAEWSGVGALTFVKLLPLALGPVTAYYAYRATRAILPIPIVAALGSVLLTLGVWMHSDLASGAARAFAYPLLTAFLCYLLRQAWPGIAATVVGLALFYPPAAVVAIGTMGLDVVVRRPKETGRWRRAAGVAGAALVFLTLEARAASRFGPALTLDLARAMPELAAGGLYAWFVEPLIGFWLFAHRSGLLPIAWPVVAGAGFFLPLVWLRRWRSPVPALIRTRAIPMGLLAAAALALWGIGHLVAFRLYQPSRFTMHTAQIILAIGGALVTAVAIDALVRSRARLAPALAVGVGASVAASLVLHPIVLARIGFEFPSTSYNVGRAAGLYRFLASQPKDVVVASLSEHANDIPIFAKRRVLVASRFGLPWHQAYHSEFRERVRAVFDAQFSSRIEDVQEVIRRYGIDLWVLDGTAFRAADVRDSLWARDYPAETALAVDRLTRSPGAALAGGEMSCESYSDSMVVVLAAECLLQSGR
jgi:hypothetical protein